MNFALFGDKLPLMTSYTTFFGLNKEPFANIAAGNDVFVAPQVASAIASIQKALASEEAVITVSGPVGAGKTTIARRALESAAEFHIIVTIGRIQFGHDEVLELLLAGLGVRQLPKSTVHRFATFRRVLQQYAEQKTRVFILIEDATRVGLDALSELEAVTAADAGVSDGANLILLGDESLREYLRNPRLARVKQRVRAQQTIAAQDQTELHTYLKHCFRQAGKDFDDIFSADCIASLQALTDGIPRVVNNLVVATLAAAAEQGQAKIDVGLLEQIASAEFGLTGEHRVADIAEAVAIAPAPEPEPIPEPEPEPEPELAAEPEPAAEAVQIQSEEEPPGEEEIPELIQDTLPDLQILAPQLLPDDEPEAEIQEAPELLPVQEPELEPEPIQEAAPEPEPVLEIQPAETADAEPTHDATEFELPILTGVFPEAEANIEAIPEPEPAPEPEPTPEPVLETVPKPEPEPVLEAVPEPVTEAAPEPTAENSEEVPDWERDPTLAQLRPDLDALERAMSVAQGDDAETDPSVAAENIAKEAARVAAEEAAAKAAAEVPEIVPEITLDKQIQAKIEEATEALSQAQIDATAELSDEPAVAAASDAPPAAIETPAEPTQKAQEAEISLDLPSRDAEKADQELEKIASELAKAKTLEDVDDMAAETLFGEEFSMMAAQVAANAPPIGGETEVAKGTLPGETNETLALSLEEDEQVEAADASSASDVAEPEAPDTSSSQRLQVLRDMNHANPPPGAPPNPEASESIVMSGGGVELPPAENSDSVGSIEDQINTSMTQNLKALNINHLPPATDNYDDDETVEKTGFFGLFKRK